ncbi:MAG: hypothetical protein H6584_08940 [Flavobacteriales bacterium]|nr:hypothetical protein [Flavobacteriales bacterium]
MKAKLILIIITIIISYFIFNFSALGINSGVQAKCFDEEYIGVLTNKIKTNRAFILRFETGESELFEPRCGATKELFETITIGDTLIKVKGENKCIVVDSLGNRNVLKYFMEYK